MNLLLEQMELLSQAIILTSKGACLILIWLVLYVVYKMMQKDIWAERNNRENSNDL